MIECPFCHQSDFTVDIDGETFSMDHLGIIYGVEATDEIAENAVAHCNYCGKELHLIADEGEVVTFNESIPFEDHQYGGQ